MSNEIRCSNCGKKCKETDSYCKSCGEPVVKTADTYGAPIEGIELAKWEEFIGEGSTNFIKDFRKNEGKKIFTSANFGAFIFGQLWFLYRKMYIEAIIAYIGAIVVIGAVYAIAMADAFTAVMIVLPIVFAYRIVLWLFANAVYKAYIKREISKPAPDMRKGGTTILAPIVGDVIVSLIFSGLKLLLEYLTYKF